MLDTFVNIMTLWGFAEAPCITFMWILLCKFNRIINKLFINVHVSLPFLFLSRHIFTVCSMSACENDMGLDEYGLGMDACMTFTEICLK